jgi:hypothetical protein
VNACQFCGNDDATVEACLSCLGYSVSDIAMGLAIVLGGSSEDWTGVAVSVHAAIEGDDLA